MKTLNILISLLMAAFAINACDSSKISPVASSDPTAPAIIQPQSGANFTVTETALDDTLMVIEWQEPDFGFESAPQYVVNMRLESQQADTMQLGITNQTRFAVTGESINNQLLTAGATTGVGNPVSIFVRAELSDSLEQPVSEPVSIQIVPLLIEIDLPEIFVPGNYQVAAFYGSDWTPADAPPLASENSDDIFQGFIPLISASPEFKFTEERDWDVNWGDGTDAESPDGILDQDGNNITAETGFYWITVDLNTDEFELTKTDWGIIGDATPDGWDADQDMTYIPEDKVWRITVDLVPGEIKFRANDAWDINFGDNGNNGQLEFGGENIPFDEEGTFVVELDLSDPFNFTFSITEAG